MQSLTVSLIQTATHWHDAPANRLMFEKLLTEVPADTQLVILPEMFSSGFSMASRQVAEAMDGPTVTWLGEQAKAHDKAICGSLVIAHDGNFYNRFVCAEPDGRLTHYDKRHRFRMAGEHEHYAAGDERQVFEYAGWRICPMVCYDLRFPVFFRNRGDYDLLLCVANWPAARQRAWNALLQARAIENQSYVAAVNILGRDGNGVEYGGGSAAYAPDGAALIEVFDRAQVITAHLDGDALEKLRAEFPVWQDADRFQLD